MEEFSSKDRDYDLWMLVAQTRDAMLKARNKELSRHHISARQAGALYTIQALRRRATPAEISRHLARESHSVSELVTRMEKIGLIRKVRDLDRKNMVRIELTEKGQAAYDKSVERQSIKNIVSTLSQKEHQQLMSSLKKIRDKALLELKQWS